MKNEQIVSSIKNGLIVSCQALEDEPLHSPFIMAKMALAAKVGGAVGIRANSVVDIKAIKEEVDLPIIGIIKRDYENSEVYITPTMSEIDDLVSTGVEIIALDATSSLRPNNQTLESFVKQIKTKYPNQLLMADCSTVDEMLNADKLGFDFISSTLVGYTKQSKDLKIDENNFEIIRNTIKQISNKFIAEGNIDTVEKLQSVMKLNVHCVVIGSIITRPQNITRKFVKVINELGV